MQHSQKLTCQITERFRALLPTLEKKQSINLINIKRVSCIPISLTLILAPKCFDRSLPGDELARQDIYKAIGLVTNSGFGPNVSYYGLGVGVQYVLLTSNFAVQSCHTFERKHTILSNKVVYTGRSK